MKERETLTPAIECLSALGIGALVTLAIIFTVAYAKEIDHALSALIGGAIR